MGDNEFSVEMFYWLSGVVLQSILRLSDLKHTFIISQFLKVRNRGVASLDGSGSGCLLRLQSSCQHRLLLSKDVTGSGGSILL